MQSMMQQQMPMLVLSGTQMAQQIASPTRLVMAQQDMFNGQNGQGKYVVLQQPTTRVIGKYNKWCIYNGVHFISTRLCKPI